MEDFKFKGKYNTKSIRLQDWDYSGNRYYFVTICTKDRENYFGEIKNDTVIFSDIGLVVNEIWNKIPIQFEDVTLDSYIVMPNHIHGIIQINKTSRDVDLSRLQGGIIESQHTIMQRRESIIPRREPTIPRGYESTSLCGGITGCKNSMGSKSLSEIIRWYKGRCTFEIRSGEDNIYFAWQPRFHESIIRNEEELCRVRKYIIENPMKWEIDGNYNS